MSQHYLNIGHPQAPRYSYYIDQYGNTTARYLFDHEQAAAQHTQPSSSRHNAPISEMMQREQQTVTTDQPSSSKYTQRAVPSARQTHINSHLTSSRRDVRAQNESYEHRPSSSRHCTATNPTSEDEHRQSASQNDPRKEDVGVLTPGMNKLPPPCWGDERLMLPLVKEQLANEDFFKRQDEKLDTVWGLYGKEREALAASHTPEPDETWTPDVEKEGILESETPLWDEIWDRSVVQGDAWMRENLREDETRPGEGSIAEEADIWTREPGGMLSFPVLRQLLRVFALQDKSPRGGGELERSDKSRRRAPGLRDEVTQRFSEQSASAADPHLASEP